MTTEGRKAEYKLFRYRHEIDLLEKSMESKAWKDDLEYQKTAYDSAYKLLVTLTGAREGSALLRTILGAQPQDIPGILATEKSNNPALWEVREDVERLCQIRKKVEDNRAAQLKSKAVEKSRMFSTSEVHIPPNPFQHRPTAIDQVSKINCSFLATPPTKQEEISNFLAQASTVCEALAKAGEYKAVEHLITAVTQALSGFDFDVLQV